MNNSLYKTNENTIISFSGGRTSAYMLYKVLTAYNFNLPENIKVVYANTGREMPQTLDFIQKCSDTWGVKIDWIERYPEALPESEQKANKKFKYNLKYVDYETASRDGEPFLALIKARKYAPNPVARFCTAEMKVRAITKYVEDLGWEKPYQSFIGIRADEPHRAHKIIGTIESGQERLVPLFYDGVTAKEVGAFWDNNDFDLGLPNNNGVTDWGNCDLCFLKGLSKKLSIIKERPDLADWWIKAENMLSEEVGKGAYFRKDQPSYAQMKIIATTQNSFDFGDDHTIPCFCGE